MLSAQNFSHFIEKNQLFTLQDSLLVAVSGGVDSVVLVHLLHQAGFKFSIAHCNFGLRGEESEGDESFVHKLAEKYNVACFRKYFNTSYIAEQQKSSIQIVARNLRYEWFDTLLNTYHYQYLLTAHHQNDVLETVLYNLVKGTGIAGLHGIKAKNQKIIRPLLCATKEEVVNFAKKNNLAWREDSSNTSSKYSRNLIRNEVIPLLKHINPNLESTFQQTVEKMSAVEKIVEQEINRLKSSIQHIDNEVVYIDFAKLLAENETVFKLYELLKPYHFNYQQVQQIIESLGKEAGKVFLTDTHTLVKDRQHLVITPNEQLDLAHQKAEILIEQQTQFVDYQDYKIKIANYAKTPDFAIRTETNIALLDKSKLEFPLVLRKWQDGDKFKPLGMKGLKKVSDFLNDKKIPLNLKNNVLVLCANNKII
jgi:tRNA(Ile)-lysidine synthase